MNGKYLLNFKTPIGGVEASLTVSGDNAQQVVDDTLELLDILSDAVDLALNPTERAAAKAQDPDRHLDANGRAAKAVLTPQAQDPDRHLDANGRAAKAALTPPEQKCPQHNQAKPSQFGGLYCTGRLEDRSFCTWTAPGELPF